jgi:hypothetical protein
MAEFRRFRVWYVCTGCDKHINGNYINAPCIIGHTFAYNTEQFNETTPILVRVAQGKNREPEDCILHSHNHPNWKVISREDAMNLLKDCSDLGGSDANLDETPQPQRQKPANRFADIELV